MKRPRARPHPSDWLVYYDDLPLRCSRQNAEALEGRKILLTEHGELAACGRKGRLIEAKSGPIVFFPPTLGEEGIETEDESDSVVGRVPKTLSRCIAFIVNSADRFRAIREPQPRETPGTGVLSRRGTCPL